MNLAVELTEQFRKFFNAGPNEVRTFVIGMQITIDAHNTITNKCQNDKILALAKLKSFHREVKELYNEI